jgi:hypothetical protein
MKRYVEGENRFESTQKLDGLDARRPAVRPGAAIHMIEMPAR